MKSIFTSTNRVAGLLRSAVVLAAAAFIASPIMTSCDNSTPTVGSSLVTDEVEIIIDSLFQATGKSVENTSVMSRTTDLLLGRFDAKGYGSLSSEIVTQFMPSANIDTTDVTADKIDSVKMVLFMSRGAFTGDSLTPMGTKVYRLNKQLPSPIFSDFDPSGYYSENDLMGETVFASNSLYNDSINKLSYLSLMVKLPTQFGRDLFNEYLQHPETFSTPSAFAQWFPGVYIKNSFGSGRVINIFEGRIHVYYSPNDSTHRISAYMAVTPEIVTNSNIRLHVSDSLKQTAENYPTIIAPAGTEVEVEFPTDKIIESFRNKGGSIAVLNDVTFTIPAEEISNDYNIAPPTDLLMVLKKDKETFFLENKIAANSGTSYYATYNSVKKQYTFTGLRSYILEMLEKDNITAEDWTFVLTPISIQTTTESNSYYGYTTTTTGMTPYTSGPALVKLDVENAKIKMVLSRQKE